MWMAIILAVIALAASMAAIAITSGGGVAEIRDLLSDSGARRLLGFTLNKSSRRDELVHCASFGADAAIVERANESQAVKGTVVARDTRVLDTHGFRRRTVEDVVFDTDTGELTGGISAEGHLAGSRFPAIGSHALIVDAK